MPEAKQKRRDEDSFYIRKSDGLYCYAIKLPPGPNGERRRKVVAGATQAIALEKFNAEKKQLLINGDLQTASPTVEQWLKRWLSQILPPRGLALETTSGYTLHVNRYIVPSIGRVRLDKLKPEHVRRLHDYVCSLTKSVTVDGQKVEQHLSTSTALKAHRVLAKALTDAMREGLVMTNVATLTDAPKLAVSDRQALSADEARTLLQSVAGDPDKAIHIALALLTGVRRGERLGITAEHLDLENGTLTVAWQLQRLTWKHGCKPSCEKKRGADCPQRTIVIPKGREARQVYGGLWLTRPKSRRGWREIPLPPMLVEMLRLYTANRPPGMAGLLFTTADGRPIDPRDATRAWPVACDEAKVTRVTLHEARHTTATLLFTLGVPEEIRTKILGHTSAAHRVYTHVNRPEAQGAMDQLETLLTGVEAEAS